MIHTIWHYYLRELQLNFCFWVILFRTCSHESKLWFEREFPSLVKTWKEVCISYLPNAEHAKLRKRLLRLEDIRGAALRKRFPPKEGSLAARHGY